jgi:hypothetical protein
MKAVTKILAGAAVAAVAAGGFAAPAAAQYYPGTGYGYGQSGGIGQILDVILNAQRYGYGYQGYANDRSQIDRCAVAVEQKINRDYGYRYGSPYGSPYGGYNQGYGYNQYNQAGAKVVGITRVERRSSTTTRVRGVATANAYANQYQPYGGQYGAPYGGYPQYNTNPYGGQYGNQYGYNNYGYANAGELTFKCDIDYRGYIKDIDIDRNTNAYYGYRRY